MLKKPFSRTKEPDVETSAPPPVFEAPPVEEAPPIAVVTSSKEDESPHVGFSASAFNILNHENAGGVDTVTTSSGYGEVTSVSAPRRLQLGMRFEF